MIIVKNDGKKHKILYRDYHGTSITALSSCSQNGRKDQYGPFTPDFVEVPHCCKYRSQYPDASDYGVRVAREIESIIQREYPDTVGFIALEEASRGLVTNTARLRLSSIIFLIPGNIF